HYARLEQQLTTGVSVIYHGAATNLEFDVEIAPGAELEQVHMKVLGGRTPRLDASGELAIPVTSGELRWRKPVAYQWRDGVRTFVEVVYVLEGDDLRFRVGEY